MMSCKKYIGLIEENGLILERMFARMQQYPSQTIGYSRQQLIILFNLMMTGQSKLKDIAHRECMPTPNLCIMFRKLESDGLVIRTIDDSDRRNTLYSVTPKGCRIANTFKDAVLNTIESMCIGLSSDEEKKLTECLGFMNQILKRMEEQNACA